MAYQVCGWTFRYHLLQARQWQLWLLINITCKGFYISRSPHCWLLQSPILHHVLLKGLAAGQTYYYRVGEPSRLPLHLQPPFHCSTAWWQASLGARSMRRAASKALTFFHLLPAACCPILHHHASCCRRTLPQRHSCPRECPGVQLHHAGRATR